MGTLRFLVLCWLASFCVVGVDTAVAQTWPTARPVTMVVPFPPGPALDLVARLVGGKISDALGQTVVVENRSGANGTIGSSLVARAAPDGYTLLAATAGTHVTAVHLMKQSALRPAQGFCPDRRRRRAGDMPRRAQRRPGRHCGGVDRIRQEPSGRAVLWLFRPRLGVPHDGRAVQPDRWGADQACAVSRGGAGHAGRDQRAHPDGVHLGVQRDPSHADGARQESSPCSSRRVIPSCRRSARCRKSCLRSRNHPHGSDFSGPPDCRAKS